MMQNQLLKNLPTNSPVLVNLLPISYTVSMLITPSKWATKYGFHRTTVYKWIEEKRIEVTFVDKKVPMLEDKPLSRG